MLNAFNGNAVPYVQASHGFYPYFCLNVQVPTFASKETVVNHMSYLGACGAYPGCEAGDNAEQQPGDAAAQSDNVTLKSTYSVIGTGNTKDHCSRIFNTPASSSKCPKDMQN